MDWYPRRSELHPRATSHLQAKSPSPQLQVPSPKEIPISFSYSHPRPTYRAYILRPKAPVGELKPTWDEVTASISRKSSRELADENPTLNKLFYATKRDGALEEMIRNSTEGELKRMMDSQAAATRNLVAWVNQQENEIGISWAMVFITAPKDYGCENRGSRDRGSRARVAFTTCITESIQIVMEQIRDLTLQRPQDELRVQSEPSNQSNAGARRQPSYQRTNANGLTPQQRGYSNRYTPSVATQSVDEDQWETALLRSDSDD